MLTRCLFSAHRTLLGTLRTFRLSLLPTTRMQKETSSYKLRYFNPSFPLDIMSGDLLVLQRVELDDVLKHDKDKYNSNNHWDNNEMPEDYFDVITATRTRSWINAFRSEYKTIELDSTDLAWMKKAYEIGKSTGRFSKCFEDELEQTVEKYRAITDPLFENQEVGYFIRTDNVSLKCGEHGVGPYNSFQKILESSVSCIHGHTPVDFYTKELKYYLCPWVPMEKDMEFRVFVCNRKITAISTQSCYNINHTLSDIETDAEREAVIRNWCDIIVKYINSVMHLIDHVSYSIDIALIKRQQSAPLTKTDGITESNIPSAEKTASTSTAEAENVDETREPSETVPPMTTTAATAATTPVPESPQEEEELVPYLIELNCFGKQYAAGSSLFHWLKDEEIMYDLKGENKVYFRYIIS